MNTHHCRSSPPDRRAPSDTLSSTALLYVNHSLTAPRERAPGGGCDDTLWIGNSATINLRHADGTYGLYLLI